MNRNQTIRPLPQRRSDWLVKATIAARQTVVLSAETQKALRRYQNTNGLRQTGYLDSDTLATMGLSQGMSY